MRTILAVAFLIFCAAVSEACAENVWVRVKGTWEPGEQILGQLRAELEAFVTAAAQARGRKLRDWTRYTFQYQPQEHQGHRYVLVNALCHTQPQWKLEERIVSVTDGGSCFFHLKFDPQQRRYYDLVINNEA
jgi:hypothetical protein